MKKFFILALCFIFLVVPSIGLTADYYVDWDGGNDSNNGTSTGSAWDTIGKANTILTAGDTVYIRAGTYYQTIRPTTSGSADNYITYAQYQDEEVIITGTDGGDLSNRSYVIIDGIDMINVDYFVTFDPNGHHNIIQNCHMEEGTHYEGLKMENGANYNQILNNVLIGLCEPHDVIQINDSGHNLIEGNFIYYGSHDALSIKNEDQDNSADYNIVRNNYIQNWWHTILCCSHKSFMFNSWHLPILVSTTGVISSILTTINNNIIFHQKILYPGCLYISMPPVLDII
ncbi:unnamed protein product, partial [marine sediment metagenome]